MNGRQPSITLGNKENEKIGLLNRDNNTLKRVRKYFTMKSLILAQDER
jgi:hypothetical protein